VNKVYPLLWKVCKKIAWKQVEQQKREMAAATRNRYKNGNKEKSFLYGKEYPTIFMIITKKQS